MGPESSVKFLNNCATGLAIAVFVIISIQDRWAIAQTVPAATQAIPQAEPGDPKLAHRPLSRPKSPVVPEGKIQLDIVVNDGASKPVLGLEPWDFKIFDNNLPRKIVSFHSYDGAAVMPDPPVEVLLVIDTANLPFAHVSFVRQKISEFLRQNGGKLKQPLTLILMTDVGVRVQPRPSTDGNAIANVVDGITGIVNTITPAMGGEGYVERFQRSARAMDNIAQNEARKPGRKLLIWTGPGWPTLNRPSDGYTEKQRRRNFDGIVELSTALRAARITVYSVAPVTGSTNAILYQQFLKGVNSYREANFGNLALKVLVTQTGGLILGPDNDLVSQISRCIEDANAFYRISFDPPAADHPDEYHTLTIQVDKPGVTVRTNTGYYNQPTAN